MTQLAISERHCLSRAYRDEPLLCPSAQPSMSESRLLGVVKSADGQTEIAYLREPLPITQELLSMAAPLKPTEVFRIAAHCEELHCRHFDGGSCRLATRIVQILPAVSESLPPCTIRSSCRWHRQEGKAACVRCPQIVTQTYDACDELRHVAAG
jgi:hypothetical protein